MKKITLLPATRIITLLSTCTLFTFISLSSCKLQRKQQQALNLDAEKIEQVRTNRNNYRNNRSDSSQQHWSFWTDGWLYYHPDSGLIAQGGILHLNETRHSQQQVEQQRIDEQIQKSESQQVQMKERSAFKFNISRGWWIAITFIIAVAILYFVYRYLI